jgi:dynein heavy chain, axonemal
VKRRLSLLERNLICTLLILNVHFREVMDLLVTNNTTQVSEFSWIKQLRYYWNATAQDVQIQQIDNNYSYSYEYLGNGSRLVLTQLTYKCFLTMTTALKSYFGGAAIGPAGTGKTETIKELSKFLAIQCKILIIFWFLLIFLLGVVFNCSENVDIKTMARFFSG